MFHWQIRLQRDEDEVTRSKYHIKSKNQNFPASQTKKL